MTKKYDKEFKLQTVRLIEEQGRTVAQVAREMVLHENTIYRWIAEFKKDGAQAFPGSGQRKQKIRLCVTFRSESAIWRRKMTS